MATQGPAVADGLHVGGDELAGQHLLAVAGGQIQVGQDLIGGRLRLGRRWGAEHPRAGSGQKDEAPVGVPSWRGSLPEPGPSVNGTLVRW